jgi:hypothetical protein
MPGSEIARFRQQQAQQEQAAQLGLKGFATRAPHKVITARIEQESDYLLQLIKAGKIEQFEQAVDAMTTELREEGASVVCHTMIEGNTDDA